VAISISQLTADTQDALSDLAEFAERVGLPFVVRSARRTCEKQRSLYAMGRSAPGGIVTNADGCQSWHVLGRAVDINLPQGATRADYEKLGLEWESMGGHWGGRFTGLDDVGHFEWHPGVTIEEVCPDPSACESVVAETLNSSGFRGLPWLGMAAIGMLSAVAMVKWKGT